MRGKGDLLRKGRNVEKWGGEGCGSKGNVSDILGTHVGKQDLQSQLGGISQPSRAVAGGIKKR